MQEWIVRARKKKVPITEANNNSHLWTSYKKKNLHEKMTFTIDRRFDEIRLIRFKNTAFFFFIITSIFVKFYHMQDVLFVIDTYISIYLPFSFPPFSFSILSTKLYAVLQVIKLTVLQWFFTIIHVYFPILFLLSAYSLILLCCHLLNNKILHIFYTKNRKFILKAINNISDFLRIKISISNFDSFFKTIHSFPLAIIKKSIISLSNNLNQYFPWYLFLRFYF